MLSPGTSGRKRQRIPHDDRELSEIKRRMWGLRVHCDAVAEEREGVEEEAAAAMDSDESDADAAAVVMTAGKDEQEGEKGGGGSPMLVRSDSQDSAASAASSSSSTSGSGGGSAGRIDGDDPRALMLRTLYQRRRAPQTRAEAKIESLIRASLRRCVCACPMGRKASCTTLDGHALDKHAAHTKLIGRAMHRATAGGNLSGGESTASVMLPLALCDAPWRDVEQGRQGSDGDMVRAAGRVGACTRRCMFSIHASRRHNHTRPQDTFPSPSDFADGPVPPPVAAAAGSWSFGATQSMEDDGGMDL